MTQPPTPGAAGTTIDLGDLADEWAGQHVTIRPHLSYAARQRVDSAASRSTAEVQPRNRAERRQRDRPVEITNEMTTLEYAVALIEEAVIDWHVLGHDGNPLPANRAGVQSPHAPALLLDTIVDEIEAHYEEQAPKLKRR